jgi:hypothetical protein
VFLRGMARQGLESETAKALAPFFYARRRKEKPPRKGNNFIPKYDEGMMKFF